MLCFTGSPCVGGGSEPVCYVLPGVLVFFLWEVNQCSMYCLESFHGGGGGYQYICATSRPGMCVGDHYMECCKNTYM